MGEAMAGAAARRVTRRGRAKAPPLSERERLKLKAEAAHRLFRAIGRVPGVYDRWEVTGAMVAYGLATAEELTAAGARVSPNMIARLRAEISGGGDGRHGET